MKRWLILIALFALTFAAGFLFSPNVGVQGIRDAFRLPYHLKALRQTIYGENHFHDKGYDPKADARLAAFDPATSKGSITLTESGGWSTGAQGLQLRGDGRLYALSKDPPRLITTLAPERCKELFQQVLTSGILNHSQSVVKLKKDMRQWHASIIDSTAIRFQISVPELGVEKTAEEYAPDFELKHYPDIIEFQIFAQLEKAMRDLVPPGDPEWRKAR
jgi:hypothetical protein